MDSFDHAAPAHDAPGRPGAGYGPALTIAAGALTVLVGVLILVWPDVSIAVVAWLFAVQLVVTGVLQLVTAVRGDESAGRRALLGVLGGVSIVVGLLCLRAPFQTALLIGLLIGAMWVLTGVVRIVHALGAEHEEGRGWGIAGGILSVAGGIVVLLYPGLSLVTLMWIFGLVLVLTGLAVVVQGVVAHRRRGS
ncbi:HdeD family acid-resistance protein [Pseudonocardia zijingensis]|jgi:uncharacterized membrane protein HdeD (DUF308 family)|uniref:HdeD family acid-resistance protein n=1 Tax=Pseudonocardia zijingensis TaxID=153376 RepID=A0ABN1N7I2_9PSEU